MLGGFAPPPLALHIVHVLGLGVEAQVSRIDTRRIIALMQDTQAGGNRAIGKLPCGSVRQPCGNVATAYSSIAFRAARLRPQPTSIGAGGHINMLPKAISEGNGSIPISASHRTNITFLIGAARKHLAAYRAGALGLSTCYTAHVIGLLRRLITKPGMLAASPGFPVYIIPHVRTRIADQKRVGRVL